MILHLVFFKCIEPYQWGDEEVIDAELTTRQHPLHIDEIRGWACGRNISERAQAMDFVVMGLFEDHAKLSAYLIHQDHMRGVDKWQRIATWSVVDIEVDSQTSSFAGLLAGGVGGQIKQWDILKSRKVQGETHEV